MVREFSRSGPCIRLGDLVRETASFLYYRDYNGEMHRIAKKATVHAEPCPSCRDHAQTQYPEGHMA